MSKAYEYRVVWAESIWELRTQVNKMLSTDEGWQPQGGISTAHLPLHPTPFYCYQAMARRYEET